MVRYASGTDADTLVTLGDPLFTGTAPGVVNVTIAGLNWTLSLAQNPRHYIEVQISAPTLRADARAPNLPGLNQQTQRVQLQADFVLSGLGSLGATMSASPSGSLFTTGGLVNTVGVIDSVKAVGTMSYAETALEGVDANSSLFASERTWLFSQSDASPAVNTRPDPWDDEVGWKSDGTYRLTLEIDLRALAVGNDAQEWSRATWGQKFIYRQGFLTFVDISVPEPSTGILASMAVAAWAALRTVHRNRR